MFSLNDNVATEGQTTFTVTFPYIDVTHVHIFHQGVEITEYAEWNTPTEFTLVTVNDVPPPTVHAGEIVRVRRITPRENLIVDYTNGAFLGEADLDAANLQLLYIQQEALDEVSFTLSSIDNALVNEQAGYDAKGARIINVGTPQGDFDATNKVWVESLVNSVALGGVEGAVDLDVNGYLNVKLHGCLGDGVTNDRTALEAIALAGHRKVFFPEGTYNLGDFGEGDPSTIITWNGLGGAIDIQTQGKVKFVCTTTQMTIRWFFGFVNATSVYIGPMEFEDFGYEEYPVTWQGAGCISLYSDPGAGPLRNIRIPYIKATNVVLVVSATGAYEEPYRVTNIEMGLIDCYNCFYGINFQNQGDDLVCHMLRTRRAVRSYFPYGCKNHHVTVHSTGTRGSTGDVDIAAFYYGFDTENIQVKYFGRELENGGSLCSVQTIGDPVDEGHRISKIKNVTFDIDVDESANGIEICDWKDYKVASLSSTLNTGECHNEVDDITVKGSIRSIGGAAHFGMLHAPVVRPRMHFGRGVHLNLVSFNARKYVIQTNNMHANGVGWEATSVDPDIGDGFINMRYVIHDGIMEIWLFQLMGSTTTFGSGAYKWLLPFLPVDFGVALGAEIVVGEMKIVRQGDRHYIGVVVLQSENNYVQAYIEGGPAWLGSGSVAWSAGDQLTMHVRIPIASDVFYS